MKKFDKNCLLCKYKYDEAACFDATYNHDYHCPSLSNIFYRKIIKIPVIKQVYELCYKIHMYFKNKKYEKYYIDEYETQDMKFIWGVMSYDDLSNATTANMHTMNDIDLIYLKDEDKYIFGIETAFFFNSENEKLSYLQGCLDAFTQFMNDNGYATDKKPFFNDVFSFGMNINTHFDSIEECYGMFRILVDGYCNNKQKVGE